ncbi:MAG: rhodanese-like domain-containing protein [Myxococcota bacterium]
MRYHMAIMKMHAHSMAKNRLWLLLISFLVACACGGAGDGGDGTTDLEVGDREGLEAWPEERELTCEQVNGYLTDEDPRMLLLNVVDEEFYGLGHIPGSLQIPWDLLPGRLDEVDPERHVVIYCRRGVRSESAYTTLLESDYLNVWIMAGGMERWNELGYPTE